jgi:hypothetical protein
MLLFSIVAVPNRRCCSKGRKVTGVGGLEGLLQRDSGFACTCRLQQHASSWQMQKWVHCCLRLSM